MNQSIIRGLNCAVIWVLTRLIMIQLYVNNEHFIVNDVIYYFYQLVENPPATALIEYPTAIVVFLNLIRVMALDQERSFVIIFLVVMAVLDALVTALFFMRGLRPAAYYWLFYMFLIGPLIWTRLDLLSAVPAALCLLYLTARPNLSGAMAAIGAAIKLWPALLIAPLAGCQPIARARLRSFAVIGLALGGASVLFFGWDRSASPLTWQADRGLQIESIPASYLMARRALGDSDVTVAFSQYNAYEVFHSSTTIWQNLASWTMVLTFILAAVYVWLIGLHGYPLRRLRSCAQTDILTIQTITAAYLSIICMVIVANKTFSPQYMIWLGGPLALIAVQTGPTRARLVNHLIAALGLMCAAMTHVVYPWAYGDIVRDNPSVLITMVLIARNITMVVMAVITTVYAIKMAYRRIQSAARERAEASWSIMSTQH